MVVIKITNKLIFKKTTGSYFQLCLCKEDWEKFKKKGDMELYKKYNKYADYNELRIYINDGSLELNGHEIEN